MWTCWDAMTTHAILISVADPCTPGFGCSRAVWKLVATGGTASGPNRGSNEKRSFSERWTPHAERSPARTLCCWPKGRGGGRGAEGEGVRTLGDFRLNGFQEGAHASSSSTPSRLCWSQVCAGSSRLSNLPRTTRTDGQTHGQGRGQATTWRAIWTIRSAWSRARAALAFGTSWGSYSARFLSGISLVSNRAASFPSRPARPRRVTACP